MRKVEGETFVELTPDGRLGAWLFALAPIAAGACYYWYTVEAMQALLGRSFDTDWRWLAALCGIAAGIVWSCGLVLLLTGRRYIHRFELRRPVAKGDDPPMWQ